MPLPENTVPLVSLALGALLGPPIKGSMAYLRCLSPEVVAALAQDERLRVDGWCISSVGALNDGTGRAITADTAVEWRESKNDAVLLLVDTQAAGAGMDGIYSAAREIGERELFGHAQELARNKLPHGYKGFVNKALARARRLARYHALTPWQEFVYLCRATQSTDASGSALAEIGLWPVAIDEKPDDDDLDRAARLVERLLPLRGASQSAEGRVEALKLGPDQGELSSQLAQFLRESDRLPRFDALNLLESRESLWLNRLRPGVFAELTLQELIWVSWRGKSGKPASWSGLTEEDGRLNLKLSADVENPKSRARLEVRWEVRPDSLGKGAVDYAVEVRAGQDVLAERTVAHSGKSPQKCVFSQDDFGELDESARFEAQVVVRALSHEVPHIESEDFLVCFGDVSGQSSKNSAGITYPSLALAVVQVATDEEAFDRFVRESGNRQILDRDNKGFITCRASHKSAKVFSPPLLHELAEDWINRQGEPGRWRLAVRVDGSPARNAEFVPYASDEVAFERFTKASRSYAEKLADSRGPLGLLYTDAAWVTDYVNAAIALWESAPPASTNTHAGSC